MAKRLYSLTVRGRCDEWEFEVWAEPAHAEDWRADGLHVAEIVATVPQWWVWLGLPPALWCFIEDIINIRNPFEGTGGEHEQ
jgi:hypothetical protein